MEAEVELALTLPLTSSLLPQGAIMCSRDNESWAWCKVQMKSPKVQNQASEGILDAKVI